MDAEIFGMSPFGGLIRYWEHLLRGLAESGVPVRIVRPDRLRSSLPAVPTSTIEDAERWIFHPSYLGAPPKGVAVRALTVHDVIYEEFPETARALDPLGDALRLKRKRIAEANLIFVPSHRTLRDLRDHYDPLNADVFLTPEGVDRAFSAPIPRSTIERAARRRARAGALRPYLLHVGGREHYKNFVFLLETYLSTDLCDRFDLVVVGSQDAPLGPEREALAHAPREACVVYLGEVSLPDLAALYRDARAVVAPSLQEGFGLPVVEAAAGGTPVAHSTLAVFEETLHGGGFAFDPSDHDGCRRAILEAVATDRDRLDELTTSVAERFDWQRTVRQTVSGYRSALVSAYG